MKALTLHQPWASLVAIGAKRIETRSWPTSYRGPLAIHAAARAPAWPDAPERYGPAAVRASDGPPYHPYDAMILALSTAKALPSQTGRPMPLGCVVATCELVACVPIVDEARGGSIYKDGPVPFPFLKVWGDGVLGIRYDHGSVATWVTDQAPFGDFTPGRFAWLLDNIVVLDEPAPARGRQGLWWWEP